MEYYICLEEDRICYVRGRFKRCAGSGLRRCLEIVEWEFVEPVPDVASALTHRQRLNICPDGLRYPAVSECRNQWTPYVWQFVWLVPWRERERLWNWRNGDMRMERTLFWAAGRL